MNKELIATFLGEKRPFKKNNYFLGDWCHQFSRKNIFNLSLKKKTLNYHWSNKNKLEKDYYYLKKINEIVLKKLIKSLNKIHNKQYNQLYWRIVLYPWLSQYTSIIFDRWETYKNYTKKNKKKLLLIKRNKKSLNLLNQDHIEFFEKSSNNHEWNNNIFLRVQDNYLKNKNEYLNLYENREIKNNSFFKIFFSIIRKIKQRLSLVAFSYNSIIFETFFFPKKDFFKLCLKNNLLPAKYSSIFEINEKKYLDVNKRLLLKKLNKINIKDTFLSFLINNIHLDIPCSYLENFNVYSNNAFKLATKKKVIISMHSIHYNDFFKVYIAEAKKNFSKIILSDHGGGLKRKLNLIDDFHAKIADKKISWDTTLKKNNHINLSPTLPIIEKKIRQKTTGTKFTIVHAECSRYQTRVQSIPFFSDDLENFRNILNFVKKLEVKIIKSIKFRIKDNLSINSHKIFSEIYGEKTLDLRSKKNTYYKSLINSKLVFMTYPTTSFSESLFLNVPTIIVCNKKVWKFNKSSLNIFNILKKNKMAFENFDEASKHINLIWGSVDVWWYDPKVQNARRKYLDCFFKVKKNWFEEWSNYVRFLKKGVKY